MAVLEFGKTYVRTATGTTTSSSFVDLLLIDVPEKCTIVVEIDVAARHADDNAWHGWKRMHSYRRDAGGGALTAVGTMQTLYSQGTFSKGNIIIGDDGSTKVRITATSGAVETCYWTVTVSYRLVSE